MFNGRIFTEGNKVLKFLLEDGICTEDAECNLRGAIVILILFELENVFMKQYAPNHMLAPKEGSSQQGM